MNKQIQTAVACHYSEVEYVSASCLTHYIHRNGLSTCWCWVLTVQFHM